MSKKNKFAAYPRLNPLGIGKDISAADLIDQTLLAYNGGRSHDEKIDQLTLRSRA